MKKSFLVLITLWVLLAVAVVVDTLRRQRDLVDWRFDVEERLDRLESQP